MYFIVLKKVKGFRYFELRQREAGKKQKAICSLGQMRRATVPKCLKKMVFDFEAGQADSRLARALGWWRGVAKVYSILKEQDQLPNLSPGDRRFIDGAQEKIAALEKALGDREKIPIRRRNPERKQERENLLREIDRLTRGDKFESLHPHLYAVLEIILRNVSNLATEDIKAIRQLLAAL